MHVAVDALAAGVFIIELAVARPKQVATRRSV
jgi:hypothetical protein